MSAEERPQPRERVWREREERSEDAGDGGVGRGGCLPATATLVRALVALVWRVAVR